MRPVDSPFDLRPRALDAGVHIVVGDRSCDLTSGVASEITRRGGKAVTLSLDELSSRDAAAAAVARVRGEHGRIGGIVHLVALREASAFPGISREELSRHVDEEVLSLLFLVQAVQPEIEGAREGSLSIFAATRGGGDFATGDAEECRFPWRGGIAGLLKCGPWEHPAVHFRAADFDARPDAGTLVRELAEGGPVEIGHRGPQRLALEVQPLEVAEGAAAGSRLDASSVVVVTGGARGITAEIGHEIALRSKATLVLLGRSPLPEGDEDPATAAEADPNKLLGILAQQARARGEKSTPRDLRSAVSKLLGARDIRRNIQRMRDAGSTVEYLPCDARDDAALRAVIADVRARHGRITGVVHGAGVIEDKYLLDKTAESFRRVVDTKLEPMLTLVDALEPSELAFFMVFSSVAGYFGNAGQIDYATANETLNRMARRLEDLSVARAAGLNWGPWAGGGMVSDEVAAQFATRGIDLVSVDGGRQAAWREIVDSAGHEARVLLGPGPWLTDPRTSAPGSVNGPLAPNGSGAANGSGDGASHPAPGAAAGSTELNRIGDPGPGAVPAARRS